MRLLSACRIFVEFVGSQRMMRGRITQQQRSADALYSATAAYLARHMQSCIVPSYRVLNLGGGEGSEASCSRTRDVCEEYTEILWQNVKNVLELRLRPLLDI